MMSTHRSPCLVCGEMTYCCNDEHVCPICKAVNGPCVRGDCEEVLERVSRAYVRSPLQSRLERAAKSLNHKPS